jgi:hypothetical protein
LATQIVGGDQGAVANISKLLERRARMLGYDSPTKTNISGGDGGPIRLSDLVVSAVREIHGVDLSDDDGIDESELPEVTIEDIESESE